MSVDSNALDEYDYFEEVEPVRWLFLIPYNITILIETYP